MEGTHAYSKKKKQNTHTQQKLTRRVLTIWLGIIRRKVKNHLSMPPCAHWGSPRGGHRRNWSDICSEVTLLHWPKGGILDKLLNILEPQFTELYNGSNNNNDDDNSCLVGFFAMTKWDSLWQVPSTMPVPSQPQVKVTCMVCLRVAALCFPPPEDILHP